MEDRGRLGRAGAQRGALSERNRNAIDPGTVEEQEADFNRPAEQQADMFGGAPAEGPSFAEQEAARQRQAEEDAAWSIRNRERAFFIAPASQKQERSARARASRGYVRKALCC